MKLSNKKIKINLLLRNKPSGLLMKSRPKFKLRAIEVWSSHNRSSVSRSQDTVKAKIKNRALSQATRILVQTQPKLKSGWAKLRLGAAESEKSKQSTWPSHWNCSAYSTESEFRSREISYRSCWISNRMLESQIQRLWLNQNGSLQCIKCYND